MISLLAANATRAQIQALCRWQTDESLNVYACLGAAQYSQLLGAAIDVRIDAGRASTLSTAVPFIDVTDLERAQAATAVPLAASVAIIDDAPDPADDADDD